ncbi:MAG: 3-dehydro-L-gulonate 2-dehydrogenase [Saprospiraceae bacterium]
MPEHTILITASEMHHRFFSILSPLGFTKDRANSVAEIFTANSIDGIYTHGVNRFPRFVEYVKLGLVIPNAIPTLHHKFGAIEQWLGNRGPGTLNAKYATDKAMQLASEYGIGCIALANTNHWIRGGTYGWQAAKAGYFFIGITNTIAAMPAWGAVDSRLGNNPFVMALPYKEEGIVLDMAMSQYSYGAMELALFNNEKLPAPGGYNLDGELTNDPASIIKSRLALPIGYWKGAGLSLLLDIFSTILSGGLSGHEITKSKIETDISQLFIAIDPLKLSNHSLIAKTVEGIIDDYHQSITKDPSKKITYPGERVLNNRKRNTEMGIPVLKKVWTEILSLG